MARGGEISKKDGCFQFLFNLNTIKKKFYSRFIVEFVFVYTKYLINVNINKSCFVLKILCG